MATSHIAYLSNTSDYTVFEGNGRTIRFRAPHTLEHYDKVLFYENGYLEVIAKYKHLPEGEEEYIDLLPILDALYMDAETYLAPIKEVKIREH